MTQPENSLMQLLPLSSSISQFNWPPVPTPMAAQLFYQLSYLDQSQWWPSEALLQYQFKQLYTVLQHAIKTVPYYQSCLSGFHNINDIKSIWNEIPILTRQDLQAADHTIRSTAPPPDHGPGIEQFSSGSTGRPVMVLGNSATQFFWNVLTLRDHYWHHRDFTGTLASIRFSEDPETNPPHGKLFNNWGIATHECGIHTGPNIQLNYCDIEQQFAWLQRVNPHYLLCNPSVVQALVDYSVETGKLLPTNLREIRTHSEVLTVQLRDSVEQQWHCRLVDNYSAKEVGYIALQCPRFSHYHLQAENLLVEILDEHNQACLPGQIGKVVISTLHNFSTPLIRYDIGDYAEVGEPCACGRGLPVLAKIMGRQRNMIILPNGKRRWPTFSDNQVTLSELFKKIQFQVIQKTLQEIEIKLVTATPFSSEQENYLRPLLQQAFSHPFTFYFSYVNDIPRSAGGKFEDFICEVK